MTEFRTQSAPGVAPEPGEVHPRDSRQEAPTSVARLNDSIRGFVAKWGAVWVEGEVTQWNVRGGNVYGRLKDLDTDSSFAFRLWSSTRQRLPEDMKVGDRVVASVKADYYVRQGEFTFSVNSMHHLGLGDQLERLEKLRVQLRSEGLFDPARKKPIPFLPQVIGLITGERSDAETDVRRNAELRWPQVRFRTEYATMQGDRCAPETMAALARLDADPDVDVIVITRGGGDAQHLLAFSDERLVRAVAAAVTPVVSAIGHENDHPLLDDVADLRASTPTDAAKRIVPDVAEQLAGVRQLRGRLLTRLSLRVSHDIAQLEQLRSRPALSAPGAMLQHRSQDQFLLVSRGRDVLRRLMDAGSRRTDELRASLRALSPGATLARGYAIVHLADGAIVRDASQAPTGATVIVTVARGSFAARSEGERAESDGADE